MRRSLFVAMCIALCAISASAQIERMGVGPGTFDFRYCLKNAACTVTTLTATGTLSAADLSFTGTTTAGLHLKTLTTAQRDAPLNPAAAAGDMIYNSTTGRTEMYDGAAWHARVRLDGDTMTGALGMGTSPVTFGANPTASQIITDAAGGFLLKAYTPAPTVAPTVALGAAGNITLGTHVVAYQWIAAGGTTGVGTPAAAINVPAPGTNGQLSVSVIAVGNQFVTGRDVCMSKAGTTTPLYLVAASPVMPATGTTYTINVADAGLTVACPTTNTALDTRFMGNNAGQLILPAGSLASPAIVSSVGTAGISFPFSGTVTAITVGGVGLNVFGNTVSSSGLSLTTGTMTLLGGGYLTNATSKYAWTNAMVAALGAVTTGNIKVCTLPARVVVKNVHIVINTAGGTVTTLTVSLGVTGAAYADMLVAKDAKAAANTVYGNVTADRGAVNLSGYYMPSFTGTTDVYAQFVSTGGNLSTTTTSTGTVYLETATLP